MKKSALPAAAVLAASAMLAASAFSASAQEVVLGAGYSDFHREASEDGAVFSVDYLHTPFYEGQRVSARWAGGFDVQETGDVYAGIGISGTFALRNDWFIETSVMPGAYFEGKDENDLGSAFEIRSLLAVGKRLENGQAVSLAISHKSNASTADENPGVNSLTLRWHMPLGK